MDIMSTMTSGMLLLAKYLCVKLNLEICMTHNYAVAVISNDTIVGHVPRTISAVCHFFLRRNGNILCQVTGRRRRSEDLVQGGLEVPCTLTFTGDAKEIAKAERLLKIAPIRVESLSKKFKVDLDDTCTSSDENDVIGNAIWLKVDGYCMVQQDKITLEDEQLLNDNHINFAQKLLQIQFPETEGLIHTLFQSKNLPRRSIKVCRYCMTEVVIG